MSTLFAKIPGFKYSVDEHGNVWDLLSGHPVKRYDIDNVPHVELEKDNDLVITPVVVLMIRALLIDNADLNILDQIIPLYLDGDPSNITLANLRYRFQLPESLEDGMHYRIPYFTDYFISSGGTIVRYDGQPVRIFDDDGYLRCCPKKDRSLTSRAKYVVVGVHRLLALTFLEYPAIFDDLQINHIDGVKNNNTILNLEWVTKSRNVRHASEIGLRSDNKPVYTRDVFTGEVMYYYSVKRMSDLTGLAHSNLNRRLQKEGQQIWPGGLQMKYATDITPWRIPVDPIAELRSMGYPDQIKTFNIHTGEEKIHMGYAKAGKQTCVTDCAVRLKLVTNNSVPINGYLFKYIWDDSAWASFSDFQLACLRTYPKNPPRSIECKDLLTNETKQYFSIHEVCCELGVNKYRVADYFKRGVPVDGRYTFKYLDLFKM